MTSTGEVFLRLARLYRQIGLLYLPNFRRMLSARTQFAGLPTVEQHVLLSGAGKIEVGHGCSFGYRLGGFHRGGGIELQARTPDSLIRIGDEVKTNNNVFICAARLIEIGARSLIGQNVMITDFEAHGTRPEERTSLGAIGTVAIGRNVWVGNNVVILKNTTIGDGCVVAAGSVVRGVFPARSIIGGVPAKVVRFIE